MQLMWIVHLRNPLSANTVPQGITHMFTEWQERPMQKYKGTELHGTLTHTMNGTLVVSRCKKCTNITTIT